MNSIGDKLVNELLRYESVFHIDKPKELADNISRKLSLFLERNKDRSKETQDKALELINKIEEEYYGRKTNKKQR